MIRDPKFRKPGRRAFRDAPEAFRCTATIFLKDKSAGRCGRWTKPGHEFCTQHAKIVAKRALAGEASR